MFFWSHFSVRGQEDHQAVLGILASKLMQTKQKTCRQYKIEISHNLTKPRLVFRIDICRI